MASLFDDDDETEPGGKYPAYPPDRSRPVTLIVLGSLELAKVAMYIGQPFTTQWPADAMTTITTIGPPPTLVAFTQLVVLGCTPSPAIEAYLRNMRDRPRRASPVEGAKGFQAIAPFVNPPVYFVIQEGMGKRAGPSVGEDEPWFRSHETKGVPTPSTPWPTVTTPMQRAGATATEQRVLSWRDMVNQTIARMGLQHRVSPEEVLAIIDNESRGRSDVGRSNTDDIGLMQINVATGRLLGYTPEMLTDPRTNIEAGVKAWVSSLAHASSLTNVEPTMHMLAYATYNAGPGHVRHADSLARLARPVQDYAHRAYNNQNRYKQLMENT